MVRRSILSICALTAAGKGATLRRSFAVFALFPVLCLALVPARAAGIVDAAFVAEALKRGAIVWDARDATAYQRGHIAGAVNVGDALRVLRNPTTEDFIETAHIEAILGGGGIDPAREIVVYSTRGHVGAYFAHFAIRYFGGQDVSVYHDGIDGWTDDKRPLEPSETRLAPVTLKLVPNSALAFSTAEMLARLQDKNLQILDVRTRDEFAGLDVRAIRGGHVPGAVNIPYEENWVDPGTPGKLARREVANNRGMSLKSETDLRNLYSRLDANKETIVYCQSGVRSAETAAVLGKLGFRNVKVYDSSWLGYAAKLDAPVENEVFFNVGALRAQLTAMQAKIDALEKALAAMRAPAPK
jgi:thiosulfate/3-mercaptopyruvate sulfurtransferase